MIPERERDALMRLTMCARIECDICKYKESSIDECEERITQNMNILANVLEADRKTEPQTEHTPTNVETMSCQECKWYREDLPCRPYIVGLECKYEPKTEQTEREGE